MPFMLEKVRWHSEPAPPTGSRGGPPRLHYGVPFDDPAARRIETGMIERMRHLADQPPYRVAGQPGIGIERHDVADIRADSGRLAIDAHEAGVGGAAQQPVQLVQLAALALPTEPSPFAFVPDPPPVKQLE